MTAAAISAETWNLVGTLFDQLAALPPEQRDLDTLDQPQSVRALLDQMLAAHDTADPQLLDQTVRAVAGRLLAPPVQDTPPADYRGRAFGPWRALEEIGRGGMAVVLKGERADGRFEKEVAIKLLPHAGRGVEHQRLLEEIHILARLEHPSIARLIDGGISDDGTPYLVMEYVHGVPITDYCHTHRLDLKARVRLLMQVIEAVRFAHRHLIVHCDIKPGNVLVTKESRTKLVDFGIAGLLSNDARADDAPRGLFCSPAYCAPEQLRGGPPDTAQDIFSLGAVLYELLCGQRIRNNKTATRMLFDAAATGPVIPPSEVARGMDRDLDAICMKALATEPGERYAGANALLTELNRWLAGEAVTARAGGVGYRLGKWLRRRWLPAAAGCVTALALIAGAGVAIWQAREAHLQAAAALAGNQRADLVRDFLVELFEVSDPDVSAGQVPGTRELLNAGTRMADEAFIEAPLLRGELLYTLARIHRKLGETDTAHALLARAERAIGDEHPDLQWQLALEQVSTYIAQTEYEQAKHLLDRLDARLGDELNEEARSRIDIARVQVLSRTGDTMPRAVALAREILRRPLVETGGIPLAVLAHSTALGVLAIDGELEEASEVGQAAVRLIATGHASPSRRIAIHNNLASVERRLGNTGAGIEFRRQALDLAREVFTPPHYQQAYLAGNLGGDLVMAGHLGEAREILEYAAAMFGQLFSTPNQRTAGVDNNLGILLTSLELPEEALPYLDRSLEVHRQELGEEHPHVLTARANRAAALSQLGRFEQAEGELLDALEIRRRLFGETHQYALVSQEGLAAHYLRAGAGEQALARSESALEGWRRQAPEGHPRVITLTGYRAQALALLGRFEEAQAAFEQARALAAETTTGVNRGYLKVMDFYSAFLVAHRPQQAVQIIPELLADPHLQGTEERPEWQSLSGRARMLRQQASK